MRRLQLVADERKVSRAYAARTILQEHLLAMPPEADWVTWIYEVSRPGFDHELPERGLFELRDPFEDEDDVGSPPS